MENGGITMLNRESVVIPALPRKEELT